MFRVKHDESERSRALSVLTNVFFHLHPAKVNRDAVRYGYTWGMGGITFYLFIVLTFTGVLLMFYYHPSKGQAYRDIVYLSGAPCTSAHALYAEMVVEQCRPCDRRLAALGTPDPR